MTKQELDALLQSLKPGIEISEGESDVVDCLPRIAYWEYNWSFLGASGSVYTSVVTYQISFFSQTPRHPKLIELLNRLDTCGMLPSVQHEAVSAPTRMIHSFFSLDVLEDLLG